MSTYAVSKPLCVALLVVAWGGRRFVELSIQASWHPMDWRCSWQIKVEVTLLPVAHLQTLACRFSGDLPNRCMRLRGLYSGRRRDDSLPCVNRRIELGRFWDGRDAWRNVTASRETRKGTPERVCLSGFDCSDLSSCNTACIPLGVVCARKRTLLPISAPCNLPADLW